MFLAYGPKDAIPVRSTKMSRRTKRRDRIALSTDILNLCTSSATVRAEYGSTHKDVVHIVFLDLGSQVNVDLNPVLRVLFFERMQQ